MDKTESCAGSFKAAIKRMLKSDTDIATFLDKFYRNTPHNTICIDAWPSGRSTQTLLSLFDPLTRSKPGEQVQEALDSRNFDVGDKVLFKTNPNSQWIAECRRSRGQEGVKGLDGTLTRCNVQL